MMSHRARDDPAERRHAAGPGTLPGPAAGARDAGPPERTRVTRHGAVGTLIVAVDDLLLVVVDLGLDVVDEATGRGQADAVGLQVVDDVLAALDACRRRSRR